MADLVYSAMRPDDIHPRILKEKANALALSLFSLFSDSFSTEVFPVAWKESCHTYLLIW